MKREIKFTIKDLSLRYNIKIDHLKYLKYKKNYTDNMIKKRVFEIKYGKGCAKTNYFNYYLPRVINRKNDFTALKEEFFTDFKLLITLDRLTIENIWEKLMHYRNIT